MADIKNNAYGNLQNPNWTQKHIYALLFTLIFIFITLFPASIAIVDGIGWSLHVEMRGVPFTWLVTRSGTYSDFEVVSVSGLLLDLLFNSVVCIFIVYPKQLVQLLRSWR